MRLADAAGQSVAQHFGLLENFLEHEMPVITFQHCAGVLAHAHNVALYKLAVIPYLIRAELDLRNVALFQIHEAVGNLAKRSRVGGNEVFAHPNANDERAAAAGDDEAIWLILVDNGEAIRAIETGNGGFDGGQEIELFFL